MSKKPELDNITLPVYEVCHKELEDKAKDIEDVIIPGAIAADKDILSQIVYDEENRKIIYPKFVMPLRHYIRSITNYLFFDYYRGRIFNNSGVQIGLISGTSEQHVEIILNDSISLSTADELDCCYSNNPQELNTYLLYHPQAGTKLYHHEISTGYNIIFIVSTRSQPYNQGFSVSLNGDPGTLKIIVWDDNEGKAYACLYYNDSNAQYKTLADITKTLQGLDFDGDTVTEL